MKPPHVIEYASFPIQGTASQQFMFLLEFAVLAPSTHNIQPWRFDVADTECLILRDPGYDLPENDPTGRDLCISLGCCTENLVLAAREFGVELQVTWLDGKHNREVALRMPAGRRDFAPPKDPAILDAIVARMNARGIFKKQPLPPGFVDRLGQLNAEYGPGAKVYPVTDPAKIEKLAGLTAEGLRSAYHRPAFRAEIASWIRPNNSSKLDGLPGYALRMNLPLSHILPWAMRRFDIGGKLGKINYLSARSAPLICVFDAPQDSRDNWKQVGRLAERVMIEANRVGMKTSIFVASVEIDDLHEQVAELVGTSGRPQFLMVIGYISTPQPPTPRHSVASRLVQRGPR